MTQTTRKPSASARIALILCGGLVLAAPARADAPVAPGTPAQGSERLPPALQSAVPGQNALGTQRPLSGGVIAPPSTGDACVMTPPPTADDCVINPTSR